MTASNSKAKTCLVIGQGSIGQRHARILSDMNHEVIAVSKHANPALYPYTIYSDSSQALQENSVDYAVIASATDRHLADIESLVKFGFSGIVLVEKPLLIRFQDLFPTHFSEIYAAYNLRFHPLLQKLHRQLQGQEVLSAHIYGGQYLPDWRPDRDYRQCYSASKTRGGGVLRDLSHELDLINWLFGAWDSVTALGGKKSDLDIDSDDLWACLMKLKSGAAVTLQLNYLDQPGRRNMTILTNQVTFELDLIKGVLNENGVEEHESVERDTTYQAQHHAILGGESHNACRAEEAMEVMRVIEAIERSATLEKTVNS